MSPQNRPDVELAATAGAPTSCVRVHSVRPVVLCLIDDESEAATRERERKRWRWEDLLAAAAQREVNARRNQKQDGCGIRAYVQSIV